MIESNRYLETIISYDPGQARDYAGITIVQGVQPYLIPDFGGRVDHPIQFVVGPIERLPLGVSYVDQRKHIIEIWKNLRDQFSTMRPTRQDPTILLDITGVGRGIYDELRHDAIQQDIYPRIYGIQWTAGHEGTEKGNVYNWPKNDAIQALIISGQNGQIRIRDDQPFASELKHELRNFRRKVTAAGNDTYAAAKDAIHDDLTMSLAQAVWYIRMRHVTRGKVRALPSIFQYEPSFYAKPGALTNLR